MKFLITLFTLLFLASPVVAATAQFGVRGVNSIVPLDDITQKTKEVTLDITGTTDYSSALQSTGMAYADSDGNWRLIFNIDMTRTSSSTSINVSVAGVTFIGNSGVSASALGGSWLTDVTLAGTNPSSSNIAVLAVSSFTRVKVSGDVPLTTKPTWADANVEAGPALSAYIPEATASLSGIVGTGDQTFGGDKNFTGTSGTGPSSTDKGTVAVSTETNVGVLMGNYTASPFASYIQSMDVRQGQTGTFPLILNPNGGDVGINVSPTHNLDIAGSEAIDIPIQTITNNNGTSWTQGLHVMSPNSSNVPFTGIGVGHDWSPYDSGAIGFHWVGEASTDNFMYFAGHTVGHTLVIKMDGNVGINEISPDYKLQVSTGVIAVEGGNSSQGLAYVSQDAAGNEWHFGRSNGDGNYDIVRQTGTGVTLVTSTWAGTSDGRLKKDIKDVTNAIYLVKKMKPRLFTWIDSEIEDVGFVAQELMEAYPLAVEGSPDSDVTKDPMVVSQTKIIPVLTKAIQEQQAIIENQKTENTLMKTWICLQVDAPIALCN